jgi:hypothetical protein
VLQSEDRAFVALFLGPELELAVADAGLGNVGAARTRLDELLRLHDKSDNPLTRGRIHEACARVAASTRDWPGFRHHLEETRNWFRRTGTPALIGQAERLRTLDPTRSEPPPSAATGRYMPATREMKRPVTLDPKPSLAAPDDSVSEDAPTQVKGHDGST